MQALDKSRKSRNFGKHDANRGNAVLKKNFRIRSLSFFILVMGALLGLRLYSLQVSGFESYRELADGQHTLFKKLIPERGEIFLQDKKGLYPAAVNRQTKMVYAVPKEIENISDTATALAGALQLPRSELEDSLKNLESAYRPLKHRLSDGEIAEIQRLGLAGVRLADETYRYYPSNELAANVLGFVGWRDNDLGGRYGLEAYFDRELSGEEGQVVHDRDGVGRWIPVGDRKVVSAKDGKDMILTIDHVVQYETEKILSSAVKKFEARGGSIIVMDPQTGRILALATSPSFNPNEYAKVESIDAYRNPVVSEAYESGSVFKTFTLAAALDNGKINPETTYVDSGAVTEAGYTIKNSDLKAYGRQTMTQVLEKSLNTGVIFAEKLLGNKNFADYVKRFGFGELTGVDMFSEAAGNINNLKNLKSDIQFFTASFGQGITVTPIQLVSAYSAIANGGVLMKPQIIEKIIEKDGAITEVEPQEVRRVISQKAALQTAQILRSVVVEGHGKRAGVPGYLVGGKTGTAQVASSEKKGYEEDRTVGSFAGFAPIDNPRFAVLVKIDDPQTVEWAESSAAPAFGELMKFLLEYYNIEPTEKYGQKDLDAFDATHNLKGMFIRKDIEDSQKEDKK